MWQVRAKTVKAQGTLLRGRQGKDDAPVHPGADEAKDEAQETAQTREPERAVAGGSVGSEAGGEKSGAEQQGAHRKADAGSQGAARATAAAGVVGLCSHDPRTGRSEGRGGEGLGKKGREASLHAEGNERKRHRPHWVTDLRRSRVRRLAVLPRSMRYSSA